MWPLDARELMLWWDRYDHLKRSYVSGFISRIEARDGLAALRYRSDALVCELKDWDREKKTPKEVPCEIRST